MTFVDISSDIRPFARSLWRSISYSECFPHIQTEMTSLLAVLEMSEKYSQEHNFSADHHSQLQTLMQGCYSVLQDLQNLKLSFDEAGTGAPWAWEN